MSEQVKIPFLGDGIDSATVISILVKPGDTVEDDQTLVELETDKATAPVPSTLSGTIDQVLVKEGDVVSQGMPVVSVSGSGSDAAASSTSTQATVVTPQPVATAQPVQQQPVANVPVQQPVVYQSTTGFPPPASPSIRRAALAFGIDLTRIPGSGAGGRILEQDVRAYIQGLQKGSSQSSVASTDSSVIAAPKPKPSVDFSKWGPVREEKMTTMRQKISEHLHSAWNTIPHVTQFDDSDITGLMALRKKHVADYKAKKTNLTMTVFALKALVEAMKDFPIFNASYDESKKAVIYKEYFHFGVAVDTEVGLVVPVIKDVDKKDCLTLSLELTELAEKARDRKLDIESMRGGTCTISNLGSLGVGGFTPLVNHPEVAIIGLGKGVVKPVIKDGKVDQAMVMPVSVSYDHRVIDGADGARFTRRFIDALESIDESYVKLKGKKSK